jgi:CheY-like chemotaxis protein
MGTETYKLLIIDDVEENRELLRRRLLQAGYAVETANEGREGLGILENDLIDLVLLDINMPIMDGITLLKQIRSNSALANIPVIMLTGIEDMAVVLECLRAGACGYVTKPYNMDQVNQQIRHCLDVQE